MAGRAQELIEHISSLSHLAGPAARRAERIQEDSDRGPTGIGWSRTKRSSVAGLGECRADGLERDGGGGARKPMGRGRSWDLESSRSRWRV